MAQDYQPSEAAAVAEIARESVKAETFHVATPDGETCDVLVLPNRLTAISLKKYVDEYRTAPERRKGIAEVTELESFIAHVKRFADEDSAIFGDRNPEAPSLTAVLNYHCMTSDGDPRFGDHRTRYSFPLSEEWVAWQAGDGKQMSQADFAAFLEDRIADVIDATSAMDAARKAMEALLCTFASPSRLLDLARGLTVRVNSLVAAHQNLKNGESVMRFETQHQDERGAPLEIPGAFLICLPVFRSDAAYQIAARLRYRLKEGRLTFWYDLYRAEETFDHAFSEACKKAAKGNRVAALHGQARGLIEEVGGVQS